MSTLLPLLLIACGGSPEEESPLAPLDPVGLNTQNANDNLRMSLAEKSQMAFSLAKAELSNQNLVDVAVQIQVTEQFAGASGHLLLIGWKEKDVVPLTLVPEFGAQPQDVHRIGVVHTWPQEDQVKLVDGLLYGAVVSQDSVPGPEDIMSITVQVQGATTKPLVFELDRTMDPTIGADFGSRKRLNATLLLDMEPRPASSEYGNVFLVGFGTIDEKAQLPAPGTPPMDFRQLGVAIQDWPLRRAVELWSDIYYYAFYTVGDQPVAGNPASKPLRLDSAPTEIVPLTIRANTAQTPPGQVQLGHRTEWKANEDQGPGAEVEETPITLEVQADLPLQPGAQLFLLGFTELGDRSAPPENVRPRDHRMISEEVTAWPMLVETALVKGLHYFLFYNEGDHPQPGDISSKAFSLGDSGLGESPLVVTLVEAAPPPPPEAPDVPTAPVTTTASIAPPPTSSSTPPGREWKAFLLALLLGGLAGFLVPRLTARR